MSESGATTAAAATGPGGGQNVVEVGSLNIQQLDQLQKQIEEEIEFIGGSVQSLRMVEQKFIASQKSLKAVKPENEQKEILVPLTNTMYVPGRLSDGQKVMIDIGTGYYAEMSPEAASKYFDRRIKHLNDQVESVSKILNEKYKARMVIREAFQSKLQALIAAQGNKQQAS